MKQLFKNRLNWIFIFKIDLPALLAFALFAGLIFFYLIPGFEKVMMDRKRNLIHEMTSSAYSLDVDHHCVVRDTPYSVKRCVQLGRGRMRRMSRPRCQALTRVGIDFGCLQGCDQDDRYRAWMISQFGLPFRCPCRLVSQHMTVHGGQCFAFRTRQTAGGVPAHRLGLGYVRGTHAYNADVATRIVVKKMEGERVLGSETIRRIRHPRRLYSHARRSGFGRRRHIAKRILYVLNAQHRHAGFCFRDMTFVTRVAGRFSESESGSDSSGRRSHLSFFCQ